MNTSMGVAKLVKCYECGTVINDPDEGDIYSDRNAAARLEREERRPTQPTRRR